MLRASCLSTPADGGPGEGAGHQRSLGNATLQQSCRAQVPFLVLTSHPVFMPGALTSGRGFPLLEPQLAALENGFRVRVSLLGLQ